MVESKTLAWERLRTKESRKVEDELRKRFERADAYRYNLASLRVRVIDSQFEGMTQEQRDALVDPILAALPEKTQADLINVLLLTPSEADGSVGFHRKTWVNQDFENPKPVKL